MENEEGVEENGNVHSRKGKTRGIIIESVFAFDLLFFFFYILIVGGGEYFGWRLRCERSQEC